MAEWTEALEEAYNAAPAGQVILSTLELVHETFHTEEDPEILVPIRLVRDYGELLIEADPEDPDSIDIYGHMFRIEPEAELNADEVVMFQAVMFSVTLPEQTDSSVSGLEIRIDNATSLISAKLDAAAKVRTPMKVIYREYFAEDHDTVQLIIGNLQVPRVRSNVLTVTATAEFNDLVNRKFPNKVYRPEEFIGLLT